MRAAVRIETGHCTVRNDWLGRAWSAFPGETLALTDFGRGVDWISHAGPDLALRLDGTLLTTGDLGDIQWAEERCALGAVLVCKRTFPGAVVVTRDLAYDEYPAMQRFVSVISLMARPAELRAPIVDALCVDRTNTKLRWDSFQQEGESFAGELQERGIALVRGHHGLIVGAYHGASYDFFDIDPGRCTLGFPAQYLVEPGSVTRLPSTFILVYAGDLANASRTDYADFLAQMRKEHKARENGQGEPYD